MIKFVSNEEVGGAKIPGKQIDQDEKKLKGVKIDKLSVNKNEERHKLYIQKFQGAKEGSNQSQPNP